MTARSPNAKQLRARHDALLEILSAIHLGRTGLERLPTVQLAAALADTADGFRTGKVDDPDREPGVRAIGAAIWDALNAARRLYATDSPSDPEAGTAFAATLTRLRATTKDFGPGVKA